ncbi:MAG: alpha/beta hydrolase [Mucilaginibacter sp.]
MTKVFLIAGMGADTRIYNRIDIPGIYEVVPVDWIEPHKTDTLVTYAQKLIHQYNISSNSIVIGNSLGGMLAIEIAKKLKLQKTILISSIKTIDEAPFYFRLFRAIPVYRLFSDKMLDLVKYFVTPVLGIKNKEEGWLFNDMFDGTSRKFLRWSMGAAVHWDNKTIPANVYHISGDKDLVFNYKHLSNVTIVKGGTHLMVFDMAKEINKWLKPILKKK